MHGTGFLAIWSDLAPEDETDWAHGMTREHSSERVRIEGFLGWVPAAIFCVWRMILMDRKSPVDTHIGQRLKEYRTPDQTLKSPWMAGFNKIPC
jgi:hypothetical protein